MHLDLVQIYAKSQLDFPDGIGVMKSISIKDKIVGKKTLDQCSRSELTMIINGLRKEYIKMKERKC